MSHPLSGWYGSIELCLSRQYTARDNDTTYRAEAPFDYIREENRDEGPQDGDCIQHAVVRLHGEHTLERRRGPGGRGAIDGLTVRMLRIIPACRDPTDFLHQGNVLAQIANALARTVCRYVAGLRCGNSNPLG